MPQPNNGWTELVPIERTKLPDGSIRLSLVFQKIVYTFDYEKQVFQTLSFDTKRPLQHYFEHKGFETDDALKETTLVYGDNEYV